MKIPDLDNMINAAEEKATERTVLTFTAENVVFDGSGKIVDMYRNYKVEHAIGKP